MRTWTATTTAPAPAGAVLDVLTDPDAAGSDPAHPPVPFDVDDLDVDDLDVDYRLSPASCGGSEVRASVSVRSGGGGHRRPADRGRAAGRARADRPRGGVRLS